MSKHPNKIKFVVPDTAKEINPKNIFYSYGSCPETLPNKKTIHLIRYSVCGIYLDGKFTIGVARCSHKDKYIRAKGRELALERAVNSIVTLAVPTETPGKTFREISHIFANQKFTNLTKYRTHDSSVNSATMEDIPQIAN